MTNLRRASAVLALAEPGEQTAHRLEHRQAAPPRGRSVRAASPRVAPSPARRRRTARKRRSTPPFANAGDAADVVEAGEAARVSAARKGDLELATEVLRVVVPHQEVGRGVRVGRRRRTLVVADARVLTGGDVAHRVAARLLGRDAGRREPPHQSGVSSMWTKCSCTSCRVVTCKIAVGVLLCALGEDLELFGSDLPEGELDALHAGRVPHRASDPWSARRTVRDRPRRHAVVPLAVVVALTVDPAPSRVSANSFSSILSCRRSAICVSKISMSRAWSGGVAPASFSFHEAIAEGSTTIPIDTVDYCPRTSAFVD
jgi:hypothetical protein